MTGHLPQGRQPHMNKPWLIQWGGDKSDDLLLRSVRRYFPQCKSPNPKSGVDNTRGSSVPQILSFRDFLRGIRKLTSYIPPKKDATNNTLFNVQYPLVI